ncbi:DUF6221 family protein [Actinomadura miaoliensis]|uniref:Uncharacterized protein n=1 Tax=Actinomadura miaoliensis TaxID=430685 RepID=A0ABP7V4Z9_9ACTN
MTLVDFLRDRLDYLIATGRRAKLGPDTRGVVADDDIAPLLHNEDGQFDLPERVIADAKAKLHIVALHAGHHRCGPRDYDNDNPCPTLRYLALPHAGDADYNPAWRP